MSPSEKYRSESDPASFPPMGESNPLGIEYGDLIEYAGNGITVMIYARKWFNDGIQDGNIMCDSKAVTRIVKKSALQSL